MFSLRRWDRAAGENSSRLVTSDPRLVLVPVSIEVAEAVVGGDLSKVTAGDGWPHEDTLDGLGMGLRRGHAPGWFVTLDGVVIGDCGIHGEPDESGTVEIGYGLAQPYRRRGYGAKVVIALSRWLLEQPGVHTVIARPDLDNVPSRRALERAGFAFESSDASTARYVLTSAGSAGG